MNLDSLANFASNPTTWAIYFIAIASFIILSLWKFRFTRDTWKDFFRFMFGVGAFLLGLGFGFQILGHSIGGAFKLSYSIESIITLAFMILYIFLFIKFATALFKSRGWEWLGAVIALFGIGCIINAIATGGRYLPFVGWFLGS